MSRRRAVSGSDVAVRVEDLGKRYRLGAAVHRHEHIREALISAVRAPAARLAALARGRRHDDGSTPMWALRDVSFSLRQGEVLGVVGRNGAGKSTLLKLLSRITAPTEGRAEVRGRVGSLLEVGTGFSGELTGRENVFLNGSILGMQRREIARRFDEIVEFAGVSRFIDTPVKRYSSGMYLRLAFAVAAHLEPDVLIIDEVLAVGDAEFQNKCLGKMSEVAGHGRTVLFVSHNLAAVSRLCSRAILLKGGELVMDSTVDDVRATYMSWIDPLNGTDSGFDDSRRQHHSSEVTITNAWLEVNGERRRHFDYGDTIDVLVELRVADPITVGIEIVLRDHVHAPAVFFGSGVQHRKDFACDPGTTTIRMRIPSAPLAQGRYSLDLAAVETGKRFLDSLESALGFEVVSSDPMHAGTSYLQGKGCIFLPSDFSVATGSARERTHHPS